MTGIEDRKALAELEDEMQDLIEQVLDEVACEDLVLDDKLEAFAQELAEGVTAERDAEIAEELPVPYTKKVPARAQIDGETLLIPRCVIATATKVPDGEWITSTKGPRLGKAKAGCVAGATTELYIPDVLHIVRVVILWRRPKK